MPTKEPYKILKLTEDVADYLLEIIKEKYKADFDTSAFLSNRTRELNERMALEQRLINQIKQAKDYIAREKMGI